MPDLKCFQVQRDERGVLSAVLDVPGQAVNVFNEQVLRELDELIDHVAAESAVRLIVFRSGKTTGFLAGADVAAIQAIKSADEAETISGLGQQLFDKLEGISVPTVAVIHGPCLGGGLEFALACRHRLAVDDSRTKLGLPEVELGLLPGWGGTQRLPALIGLAPALPMILMGKKLSARKAQRCGLVDAVATPETLASDLNQLVDNALAGNPPQRRQPTLLERLRDGTRLGQWFVLGAARRQIAPNAEHYPALTSILKSVAAGFKGPRERGLAVERREFGKLLFTESARSLIGLFFQRERARSRATWVGDQPEPAPVKTVGVIGGGVMGAGIAQLCALQGYRVLLKEINQDLLDAGMQRIGKLFDESVAKQVVPQTAADGSLAAITATLEWDAFAEVELAVEAVTERLDVKHEVFEQLSRHLPADAVLASNTSALSITELAEAATAPERVAGLHFFNPVHRMHLVEVVRTAATGEAAIARLVEFVRKLGKTPVVVADSPGFLVNRILFPYLDEAVRMVVEGAATDEIDRALKSFGMPMGPLELLDTVGIDVAAHVSQSLTSMSRDPSPTPERLQTMVKEGRLGKKSGAGFYHYQEGRRKRPVTSGAAEAPLTREQIQNRAVLAIINEAARCLEEKIVTEPWMVDLAMVLGTGFAPFHGGPLRLADRWGIDEVMQKLESHQQYGKRFAPASLLEQLRREQRTLYTSESGGPTAKRPAKQTA